MLEFQRKVIYIEKFILSKTRVINSFHTSPVSIQIILLHALSLRLHLFLCHIEFSYMAGFNVLFAESSATWLQILLLPCQKLMLIGFLQNKLKKCVNNKKILLRHSVAEWYGCHTIETTLLKANKTTRRIDTAPRV